MPVPRMTIPTERVLEALLADPSAELYGIEIGDAAGLPSGTVHPILARLEATWSGRNAKQRSDAWIDRQMGKIDATLKAMSTGLGDKAFCSGIHFSLSDVAVGCALGYLDLRFTQINWRELYPNLARLQDKLMQRPSFAETIPPG